MRSPLVAAALQNYLPVKVDVTDYEKYRERLHELYGVHGTPALAFRDRRGRLLRSATVTGSHVSAVGLRDLLNALAGR